MAYSLVPVVVDLRKVKAVMGSKDVALLQAVLKKYRKEMLGIDALFGDFEYFEKEIKKEYRAFEAGDFSSVDLKASYDEDEEDEEDDEEPDPDVERFDRAYAAARTKKEREEIQDARKQFFLQKYIEEIQSRGDGDDDEEEDEDEPCRVLSTGAALTHLVLGGNLDPSAWSQYGYALRFLCEHLGTVPAEHDAWSSIRSASFEFLDNILKRAKVSRKEFSTYAFLVERGAPVKILEPDDFPYIGYLKRNEIRRVLKLLDPEKIETVVRRIREDGDWARDAFGELRRWLEAAGDADRDLVCFYC